MIATLSYHHLHACRLKVYVINAKFHMKLYVELYGQLYMELQHIAIQINVCINASLQIPNSVALQLF